MAYLEQSTRYVPVHRQAERPLEVSRARRSSRATPLAGEFARTLDLAFETYARWIPAMEAHFRAKYPEGA